MKGKLKYILIFFISIVLIIGIGYQLSLQETQRLAMAKIKSDFIKPFQKELRSCGFKDIEVKLGNIQTREGSDSNMQFIDFDIVLTSDLIDEYEYFYKQYDTAVEFMNVMEKMEKVYQKYKDYTSQYTFKKDKYISLVYKPDDKHRLIISGKDEQYYVRYASSYMYNFGKDDEEICDHIYDGYYIKDGYLNQPEDDVENSQSYSSSNDNDNNSSNDRNYYYHDNNHHYNNNNHHYNNNNHHYSHNHNGYDDGYNSIIEDEEYDEDRYKYDDDYRKGVDDAQDELDEDY